MTNADEGVYYCCVPDGPCGNSSSAHTTVQLSTPPVLSAITSTQISTAGSNVTLSCNISNKGTPPALLTWRRNGQDLSDGGIVSVDETFMTLTLVNVTLESAGVYVCAATSVLSYRSDAVELFVKAAPQWSTITITVSHGADVILPCVTNITSLTNYTWEQISTQLIIIDDTSNNTFSNGSLLLTNVQNSETYKCTAIGDSEQGITIQFVKLVIQMDHNSTNTQSQVIYLRSKNARSSCHDNEFEDYLMVILQRFLYETCNCTDFEVLVNCNDTGGSNTVYSVQFVGPMAGDLLKLWLTMERNSDDEIELGVATFTLCNQTCVNNKVMPGSSDSSLQLIPTGIILIILCIMIAITLLMVCAFFCYYKCSHKTKNYDIEKRMRTSVSTSSEGGLMAVPPANYDKLNHIKYSMESSMRECNVLHETDNQIHPINQEAYSTSKPTVKQMKNGKGFVRNKDLTAIINVISDNNVINGSIVTPSTTHPLYYDVDLPCSNADQT
ncbi:titin-like isoform X2 [Dysidea avara]